MKDLIGTLRSNIESDEDTGRAVHVMVNEFEYDEISRLKRDGIIKNMRSYVRDLIRKDLSERRRQII